MSYIKQHMKVRRRIRRRKTETQRRRIAGCFQSQKSKRDRISQVRQKIIRAKLQKRPGVHSRRHYRPCL